MGGWGDSCPHLGSRAASYLALLPLPSSRLGASVPRPTPGGLDLLTTQA